MEEAGYPSFILYLMLLIGVPLALSKPFKAFLLIAFMLSAANADAFTFTRLELLGPYFNANDACLLIALIALLPYIIKQTKQIQIPDVTKWIFAVLLIGFVHSWIVLGWTYEVLRALRWAIDLPLYFIIAATMINRKEKARPLLIVLFLGSVLSAIQHFVFVKFRVDMYGFDIDKLRSIAFLSLGTFFIVASLVWMPKINARDKLMVIGGCIFFAISMLLNQTRSVWFSTAAVLPIAFVLYKQKRIDTKIVMLPIILMGLTVGVFLITFIINPEINLIDMIIQRLVTLESSSGTFLRLVYFQREMEAWLGGFLMLGRGLAYFAPEIDLPFQAWGHLGHVTTLAQLGLIGLFVYSFYLPKTIITVSKNIWSQSSGEVKYLGLFAGITMIWYWICFIMSGSFLGHHAVTGIVFGAAWRQAKLIKTQKAKVLFNKSSQ